MNLSLQPEGKIKIFSPKTHLTKNACIEIFEERWWSLCEEKKIAGVRKISILKIYRYGPRKRYRTHPKKEKPKSQEFFFSNISNTGTCLSLENFTEKPKISLSPLLLLLLDNKSRFSGQICFSDFKIIIFPFFLKGLLRREFFWLFFGKI